jgi:DNA-binding protein HU-beta
MEVLVSNITKAELLDAVANDAGVSKKDAESVLGAFFDLAIASAKKGDKVSWPGFGSFEGIQKKASTGRNPQTGAPVQIPARKAIKFKASSTIREALNG